MHEISAVQEVLAELERLSERKPDRVKIKLGLLRAEPESFVAMVREHLMGTELEGLELEIEPVPVEIECSCGLCSEVEVDGHIHFVRCPMCGKIANVLKGNELEVIC